MITNKNQKKPDIPFPLYREDLLDTVTYIVQIIPTEPLTFISELYRNQKEDYETNISNGTVLYEYYNIRHIGLLNIQENYKINLIVYSTNLFNAESIHNYTKYYLQKLVPNKGFCINNALNSPYLVSHKITEEDLYNESFFISTLEIHD